MKPTRVREVWASGSCALNCWLTSPSAVQAELLATLDFDSFVLDLQHGDIDYRDAVGIFQALRASGATPMARVAWNEPGTIGRLLDAGAFGIICPMVSSRADAEAFVGACRYPPHGYRSCGPVRANLHSETDVIGYFTAAETELITFALIETAQALENLDEIMTTPGLDGIYIGASDLAIAHGAGPSIDYSAPEAARRHETILAAARRHGRRVGLHAMTDADLSICVEAGADLVTTTTDRVALLREAERQLREAQRLRS
jgi:4-hydroxy-2-oxoheptanedioate aldolase